MIEMLLQALACLLDIEHCARWQATPSGPRCAEVELRPRCETTTGWHEFVPGVVVCTVDCPGGSPTT